MPKPHCVAVLSSFDEGPPMFQKSFEELVVSQLSAVQERIRKAARHADEEISRLRRAQCAEVSLGPAPTKQTTFKSLMITRMMEDGLFQEDVRLLRQSVTPDDTQAENTNGIAWEQEFGNNPKPDHDWDLNHSGHSSQENSGRTDFEETTSQETQVFQTIYHASSTKRLSECLKNEDTQRSVKSAWVINPNESLFFERWDTATMFALLFTAVVTPIQVSMTEVAFNLLFLINCGIDVVFLIDMVLQFFLMYPTKTRYGSALEFRHAFIIKHYLKSWFLVDLVSCVPFDVFALLQRGGGAAEMKMVKIIRLIRLLKLLRVLKASRLLRRYELRMSISYQRFALVKFFVVLAAITHWMACLWALSLKVVDMDSRLPRWVDSFEQLEENIPDKTRDTPWKLYVACLYFTCYTITSVGYGDIGPKNLVERIICTVMIVVSGISWAMVLGQVSGVMLNMSEEELSSRKLMDRLNSMMEERQISNPIRVRLRSFFLQNRLAQRYESQKHLLNSLSSGLQSEVMLQLNRAWFTKVSFFNEIMEKAEEMMRVRSQGGLMRFLARLSQQMIFEAYAQQEIFGVDRVLYIIKRGIVSRRRFSSENSFGRLVTPGGVVGIDFVLSNSLLRDAPENFAWTYVETIRLTHESLQETMNNHVEVKAYITQRIRRFVIRLAVQRAAMLHVRNRKSQSFLFP